MRLRPWVKEVLHIGGSPQAPRPVPPPSAPPAQRREDLIERLCRESGVWAVSHTEPGRYVVIANDHTRRRDVHIRWRPTAYSVQFQCWLELTFPLDRTPSGLFARVLMRNFETSWGAWFVSLGRSMEAHLCCAAGVPVSAVDVGLFDHVCRELTNEVNGFSRELADKFAYDPGQPIRSAGPPPAAGPDDGIRWIDSPPGETSRPYRLPGR